jgi:hypothetical protein
MNPLAAEYMLAHQFAGTEGNVETLHSVCQRMAEYVQFSTDRIASSQELCNMMHQYSCVQ